MQKASNEELAHYKAKIKKYRNEVLELREQLHNINAKFVKVSKDKDRYKQKIIDTKEDIARFNQLVDEKSKLKAEEVTKELNAVRKALKKKDHDLAQKVDETKQLRNQLSEQNLYIQELEAKIEEMRKERELEKIRTPESKKRPYEEIEIEMIDKNPLNEEEDEEI